MSDFVHRFFNHFITFFIITELNCGIDMANVKGNVIFKITQKMGNSGIKTLKNSKNPASVELHLK